jgi:OPA family glycerol-3-phosphate transporter-like MFS transporter
VINKIRNYFAAAKHVERLPDADVKRLYPQYRWRIMESTFLGYAMFYLVRNNLAVVSTELEAGLGYTHSMIGSILAITAISYGVGKFVMGSVSDRSDTRKFMALGLLLTAICNFMFGWAENYTLHLLLWSMNGFFQGMGWPPCGRSMGHWFSERERGLMFSIWNTSHNVGGGVAGMLAAWAVIHFGGWQYAFFVPGVFAGIGSIYLFWRLRDTPQSVGLPSIEEYNDDYTSDELEHGLHEKELSFKELFFDHVLTNKWVWLLAFANFFAYIARYSMLDWGPMYLSEVKGATLAHGGIAILAIEFGGIPSTIFLGWLSDKVGGRRGMVAVLCMLPILLAFIAILLTPEGYLWMDMIMLAIIGCFIYPVINFIVILALDMTSKKAIGTAAGFIGLFGYIGRAVQAKGFGSMLTHYQEVYDLQTAWDMVLYSILGCTFMAMVLLAFTWKMKPKA